MLFQKWSGACLLCISFFDGLEFWCNACRTKRIVWRIEDKTQVHLAHWEDDEMWCWMQWLHSLTFKDLLLVLKSDQEVVKRDYQVKSLMLTASLLYLLLSFLKALSCISFDQSHRQSEQWKWQELYPLLLRSKMIQKVYNLSGNCWLMSFSSLSMTLELCRLVHLQSLIWDKTICREFRFGVSQDWLFKLHYFHE